MKKLITIVLACIFVTVAFSQVPSKISYQAVVRNADGALIKSSSVGVKISILKETMDGAPVFVEIFNPNPITNANGLVTIEIGGGIPVAGSLSSIDWKTGAYFIKTEIDPDGQTNYSIIGTSQILSVPYALFSESSQNLIGTIEENQISDLKNYLISETDPGILENFDLSSAQLGDLLRYDGSKWSKLTPDYLTQEEDPVFGVSVAGGITGVDTSYWNNKSNFSGYYNDLTDKPELWDSTWNTIKNKPSTIDGYGIIDAFSGDFNELENKPGIATIETDGFMSATDKTKLDGLQNATITAGDGITITGTYPNLTIAESQKRFVGELYGGGVVFWVDHTGEHGLIVSMVDLSTGHVWSNISDLEIGATAQSDWDGKSNTTAIAGQIGHSSSAAQLCINYTNLDYGTGIFSDWYLPSVTELNHLWNNFYEVQKALDSDGNPATTGITKNHYWSSSEVNNIIARTFFFQLGQANTNSKFGTDSVRAIRSF